MAKSPSSKKKDPRSKKKKAGKIKQDKFGKALRELKGVRHVQYFGQLSEDGMPEIDLEELKKLRRKLKKEGVRPSRVRFVAFNSPFKRGAQAKPA